MRERRGRSDERPGRRAREHGRLVTGMRADRRGQRRRERARGDRDERGMSEREHAERGGRADRGDHAPCAQLHEPTLRGAASRGKNQASETGTPT